MELSRRPAKASATSPAVIRLAAGKEARQHCPRSSHADLPRFDRDPIELLIASNEDRLPELIPVRHSRMLESPFTFFRGTAGIQAYDLAGTPGSGIMVQACGDCHLLNFGGFATPERSLAFDINDFDETYPAPWEWDLKRLAVSLVLAARWRAFPPGAVTAIVAAAARRYREAMAHRAAMTTLDTWYDQITYADVKRELGGRTKLLKYIEDQVATAQRHTSEQVFHKFVENGDGTPRIADQPPLLFHPRDRKDDSIPLAFLKRYATTLRDEYRALLLRFTFADAAVKVVGVGSVGTRCYVALMLGQHGEPLFLQIKESRASVLEGRAGRSPWRNHGHRVVAGQRMMQAVSDIFLGWGRGPKGRDFYVRQLRDMKIGVDITRHDASMMGIYGEFCARALARAHAKGGEAARIAGYLGNSTVFDDAIVRHALAYADQVERDYAAFRTAIRAGRLPTETTPNDAVTMIA